MCCEGGAHSSRSRPRSPHCTCCSACRDRRMCQSPSASMGVHHTTAGRRLGAAGERRCRPVDVVPRVSVAVGEAAAAARFAHSRLRRHCAPARARRCRCRRTPRTRCAAGRARNLQREAAAAAFFASHTVSHVLAELLPPHFLQSLRLLPCSQMPLPPPSLHWLRLRPCSQHRCRRRTPCTRYIASRDDNGRCLCRRSPCRGALPPVLVQMLAPAHS